ncbi:MAG: hypothetical protein J6D57_08295 [Mogibacterium sp.]|nr:hypothetical protein [Mogibacterium sp.]
MMTYLPIVISLCSLGFAIYSALSKNNKDETTAMTTVIVKLDSLQSDIRDIKSEINNMRDDQRRDHDALIRLDASIKSAWKQIDKLTGADREE